MHAGSCRFKRGWWGLFVRAHTRDIGTHRPLAKETLLFSKNDFIEPAQNATFSAFGCWSLAKGSADRLSLALAESRIALPES